MLQVNTNRVRRVAQFGAAMLVVTLALIACSRGGSAPKIAIVNTLTSLDPIVETFRSEVLAAVPEAEFVEMSPTAANFESGLQQMVDSDPDIVISLNTPNSISVGAALKGSAIPQVFGMVTDPLGSGLIDSYELPGSGRTGVGLLNIQQTLELAVHATGATLVAALHAPSDPASVSGLELAREAASRLGVELVEMIVEDDSDLDRVLRNGPPSGTGVFLLVGSPFAARNLGDISLVARTWDVPTASALTLDRLPDGFLIGVAPDSADLGHQLAQRAIAILNGGSAGDIPVGLAANVSLLDLNRADRYGLTIPDSALVEFDRVIGIES